MTDDPTRLPDDEAEATDETTDAEAPGGAPGGETAGDLDTAQLEAAAEGAEDEIGDEAEDEAEDETVVTNLEGVEAAPAMAPGAGRLEPEVRGPRVRAPKTTRTAFAIDPALRIKDSWSAAFVIVCVAIFAAILGYALLFGRGGAFTPIATPSPIPTEAPSENPSPSVAPTGAPSPSAAPTVASTIAPSAAPSPAPSPAAT
jgi:hypothetical protein